VALSIFKPVHTVSQKTATANMMTENKAGISTRSIFKAVFLK
jgi:hypothetical protein